MQTLKKLHIVVLISGNGSNLQALIDAAQHGLAINIAAVISDQADAYGLIRAQHADIPTHIIERHLFLNYQTFEDALQQQIEYYHPDLVVLAGFMRRLHAPLVEHFAGCMLNIHPSLLPKYPGLHTHERVLTAGDTEHGASIHFVTAEVDAGPVICQGKIAVLPSDDANSLQQRVQKIEHQLYPKVLAWFAAGRVHLTNTQTILLDGAPLLTPVIFPY